MKYLLLSLLALFLFSSFPKNNLFASGLNDISSRNTLEVWAVGDIGLIMKSGDRGNFWTRYYLGSNNYNSIATNSQYIWIAGDNGDLERSANTGGTFTQIIIPATANLNSVYFASINTGWVSGDNGTIFKSTNGGLNWTVQTSNTSENLNQIKFFGSLNGVACGSNGTVLYTSDGGSTWSNVSAPTTNELLSIDIKGSTIFVCGTSSAVYKSTNYGSNWSFIDYKIETKSDVTSIVMLDNLNYYSVGGGGDLSESLLTADRHLISNQILCLLT